MVAGPALTGPHAEEGFGAATARGDLRIEFSQPSDWRCASNHGCVVCMNIADGPSYVVMRYAHEKEPHRREIASGHTLEVCPAAPEDGDT